MQEKKTREDRRINPRSNMILPGRFRLAPEGKKRRSEKGKWFNSHVSNVSREGFCLAMPENLNTDETIEFVYHIRGETVAGRARIAWMDRGESMAGCYVIEYLGVEKEEPEREEA